jgi:hypothetical protein
MSRELMQQALEKLEFFAHMKSVSEDTIRLIAALRQALETEPFEYWNAVEGWVKIDEVREHFDSVGCGTIYKSGGEGRSPLYTAPPKREWVGLTDDELTQLYCDVDGKEWCLGGLSNAHTFYEAVEAKLKEKNT